MSVAGSLGLVAAGIGGGLSGSIAGLASLVTYPALLAFGLSPIAANATNIVALVCNAAGSISASRPELAGQGPRLRRLVPLAMVAGLAGAVAVLLTPSSAFARIVPWLIGSASVVIVVPRRGSPRGRPAPLEGLAATASEGHRGASSTAAPVATVVRTDARWLPLAIFAVAFYGAYFGAAAGVVLLATLLAVTGETLVRANAAKNVILGLANFAGAVAFALLGPVHWSAALPMAIGCFIGSRIGPGVVRRVPAAGLRAAIGIMGIGLAVVLAYNAYT